MVHSIVAYVVRTYLSAMYMPGLEFWDEKYYGQDHSDLSGSDGLATRIH